MSDMVIIIDRAHARTYLKGVAACASSFPRVVTESKPRYESQVSIALCIAAMERNGRVRKPQGLEPELGVRSFRTVLAYLDELQEPRARINKQEKVMIQMKDKVKYLGIDCAKATFESYLEDHSKTQSWDNTDEQIHALITWINKQCAEVVVILESTGGYERKLLRSLYAAEIGVAQVDALRAHHFAKSEGLRAKTDPIDAKMLARFGREKKPALWQPVDIALQVLRQLVARRRHIADMISLEKTRLEQAEGFTREDILELLQLLEHRQVAIEARIKNHLQSHPSLYKTYQRLMQPKGIGPVTAYTLLAFMPELGSISDKRAASLAGLAPYTQTSGTYQGKASIAGGRKEIRKPLNMAAKVAKKHNPILKQFYLSLISKGKHKKVANTAVMRKLIVLMNRIAADPDFTLHNYRELLLQLEINPRLRWPLLPFDLPYAKSGKAHQRCPGALL